MNDLKATPGPWRIDGIAIEIYQHVICWMGEPAQYAGDTPDMCENHIANAHLIAAAPEMYEELADIYEEMQSEPLQYVDEDRLRIKALLAKARGENG